MVTKQLAKFILFLLPFPYSSPILFPLVFFSPQYSPYSSTLRLKKKKEACEFVIFDVRARANSEGIRQACFHLLEAASPAFSALQPVVTLTSGDHTSNTHTLK